MEINMNKNYRDLSNAVNIPNNYNTRHFGGYATESGRTVIEQKLIRSGMPTGFDDNDIKILSDAYNLKRVIDFRTTSEAEPSLTNVTGVEYIHMGMFDESSDSEKKKAKAMGSRTHGLIESFYALGGTVESVIKFYSDVYIVITQNEYSQNIMRLFFESLLDNADGGCILFHCTGGKDRTGMAAIFLLKALGVDWDKCLEDYMMTNEFFEENIRSSLNEVKKETNDPEVLEGIRLIMSVDLRYLDQALELIMNEYGSIDNYLLEVLHLTGEKIERLRTIYTV